MTGDMQRDREATEHRFATADVPWTDDDYAAAKAETVRETCGRDIDFFYGVNTLCGRPAGHDGDCHPVPLAGDGDADG